jgi:glycosyltransferase involved in cell wall biosynthesis
MGTHRMKLAWFTHRYHPCIGGAETYGRAMVRRFVAAGHEVDVFTSDAHELAYFIDPRRRRVDAPAESVVDGARVRRFATRHVPLQRYIGKLLGYAPHWPTRCRRASYMPILPGIERVRGAYDAVFGVGFPFTVFSYAALRTAQAAGAPLVLTPFLHLATPGDAVHRSYTRPHQVRLLAAADLVVVPTELEAAALRGWGIDRTRILHLPMAIEHAEVTGGDGARFRTRWAIPPDAALVGQLGALDPNKGSTDLIRAVQQLNTERDESARVYLVLAGAATPVFDAFAAALPADAARWLRLTGPLPAVDVPDFYAAIDVFSMPSRTDSFGIVFLEAWANARPVVAAAAGGVVEVVQHDRNGLLVPFGDPRRLAGALGRLLCDGNLAARLGEAGFRQVIGGYTWDERYAALESRLGGLLTAGRKVPIIRRGLTASRRRSATDSNSSGSMRPLPNSRHPRIGHCGGGEAKV